MPTIELQGKADEKGNINLEKELSNKEPLKIKLVGFKLEIKKDCRERIHTTDAILKYIDYKDIENQNLTSLSIFKRNSYPGL